MDILEGTDGVRSVVRQVLDKERFSPTLVIILSQLLVSAVPVVKQEKDLLPYVAFLLRRRYICSLFQYLRENRHVIAFPITSSEV